MTREAPASGEALDEVLAQPGSLSARQALASAWEAAGDPRGRLLRLELEIHELVRADRAAYNAAPVTGRRVAVQALLRTHGDKLVGNVPALVDSYELVRGMVGLVRVRADRFPRIAQKLFAEAPVQHLILTNARTGWSELVRSPYLAKLVSLDAIGQSLGDRDAAELAATPHASTLRWIDLSDNAIGRPGVEALAASAHLAQAVFLSLRNNPCCPSPERFASIAQDLNIAYGRRRWLESGPPPQPDELGMTP